MPDKRKPYALIAEADPARAARYMGFVVELGLEPNHARDGDTAKNTLRTRGAPALVITELSLPRSDGFSLLTDLRSRCSPEQTPAVVVSGFLELRTRAWNEREQLGIIEVLSTSSPPETIFNALKRAVSAARTPRAPSQPQMAMADQPRVDHAGLAKIQLHIADPNVASAALSKLAQEIAEAFYVPLAMVWVRDPIWFSGRSGPESDPLHKLSFEELLEAQSIAAPHGGAPELAADTAVNRTRMGHPLVQRGLVRSLAAVPLSSSSGAQLGVLCLMHQRRMALRQEHLDALIALARRLSGEIEVREAIRRNESERQRLAAINTNAAESLIELEAMLDELESGVLLLDAERRISFANRAIAEQLGRPLDRIVGASFEEFHQTNARLFDDPTDYLQRIHILPDGPFVLR
ncbi:MAG TPA: PAS domain-containing protein, partial [Kofleriaceae bacterium]|nr:PAS domain-containing protein [Kofleriaceae bacterium]